MFGSRQTRLWGPLAVSMPSDSEPWGDPLARTYDWPLAGRGVRRVQGITLNAGQRNAFRVLSCPVTRNFVRLPPFPVVGAVLAAVMKLTCAAGAKTMSPLVITHKGVDGSWAEFPFHEQNRHILSCISLKKASISQLTDICQVQCRSWFLMMM